MIMTIVGLVVLSAILLWIAAIGFLSAMFNNIGGAGKTHEVVIGLIAGCLALWAIYALWKNYSPLGLVVDGGAL